jgi:1,4-dihydroxy-2-naphthoyl-CoA hydrolase
MAAFSYFRTIHFADTDAAGVVFFARYLSIAHEAYEEALAEIDLQLHQFFADSGVIVPVTKSEASYLRPLNCAEKIRVDLQPTRLAEHAFAIDYTIYKLAPVEKRAAVIRTEHTCIDSKDRRRQPLPPALAQWVDQAQA